MLKNISPLISPSLLKILAEMGHGDEIVFSDAHFPGHTFNPTVLRADGLGADALLAAVDDQNVLIHSCDTATVPLHFPAANRCSRVPRVL